MANEQLLRRDVEALCATQRHRDVPGSLRAARSHCRHQLEEAGWTVDERAFPSPAGQLIAAGRLTNPRAIASQSSVTLPRSTSSRSTSTRPTAPGS